MTSAVADPWNTGFIVSKRYDAFFFLFSPLLTLLLVAVIVHWPGEALRLDLFGVSDAPAAFFVSVWTLGHNFAVVFRSHANPEIFRQYPLRFTLVPIVLFVGLLASQWLLVGCGVLAGFWALYHAAMQNFGFCRLYDVRRGNPPAMGRRLDYLLNLFLLFGPIFWGVNLVHVVAPLRQFRSLGWDGPAYWVVELDAVRETLGGIIAIASVLFYAYYLFAYWRLTRRGYRWCPQKLVLIVVSGAAWALAYGFLSPWQAFFVTNFFHPLQYFAIVWWREKRNIRRVFGFERTHAGSALVFAAFVACVGLVGVASRVFGQLEVLRWAAALTIVVALMHYWWDGFVWSVQKHQV